jgi:hypothetical protein
VVGREVAAGLGHFPEPDASPRESHPRATRPSYLHSQPRRNRERGALVPGRQWRKVSLADPGTADHHTRAASRRNPADGPAVRFRWATSLERRAVPESASVANSPETTAPARGRSSRTGQETWDSSASLATSTEIDQLSGQES